MPGLTTGPVGVGEGKTDVVIEDEVTEELETEADGPLEPPETGLDEAIKVPEIDELRESVMLLDIEDVNKTLTLDESVNPLEIEDAFAEELTEEALKQETTLQSGL